MIKVIQYSASWCGPCRQVKSYLPDLCSELNVEYEYKDIDEGTSAEYLTNKGIRSVPYIEIEVDNQAVDAKQGFISPEDCKEWISSFKK